MIAALYNQSQPTQQQEANTWLMGFSATPAAWEVGVNLLGTGQATEVSRAPPLQTDLKSILS